MSAILQVRNLSVRFGGLAAITDMTMEVREGEVLSLIGPNGAGKTTAFNAITGYLAPSSGEIAFRGKDLRGMKTDAIAALGMVRTFQKTSVFGGRSALENVLIGLHLRARQTPLAILLGFPYVAREERALRRERARADWEGRGRGAGDGGCGVLRGQGLGAGRCGSLSGPGERTARGPCSLKYPQATAPDPEPLPPRNPQPEVPAPLPLPSQSAGGTCVRA